MQCQGHHPGLPVSAVHDAWHLFILGIGTGLGVCLRDIQLLHPLAFDVQPRDTEDILALDAAELLATPGRVQAQQFVQAVGQFQFATRPLPP